MSHCRTKLTLSVFYFVYLAFLWKLERVLGSRADPLWNMCFLCQAKDQLTKYKDIRQCLKCKAYWKGKRLLKQDAEALFLLQEEDLKNLPHRDTQSAPGTPTIPLYAFATCAGAAVRRYGSLYHMVKSDPAQREALAQHLSSERIFAEQQKLQTDYDSHTRGSEHLPPSALPASRPEYASSSTTNDSHPHFPENS
jgi:hypothetical protein